MKHRPLSFAMVGAVLASSLAVVQARSKEGTTVQDIKVSSPVFKDGEGIPKEYTCDGAGKSPPLEWSNVPDGTKSLAVVVLEKDAPRGTSVQWVLFDIPAGTMALAESSAAPEGARQGKNSTGKAGWSAPCPAGGTGTHEYRFKVYALGDKLTLNQPSEMDFARAINKDMLGYGELIGTYERTKK